jgi:hypothetical protein
VDFALPALVLPTVQACTADHPFEVDQRSLDEQRWSLLHGTMLELRSRNGFRVVAPITFEGRDLIVSGSDGHSQRYRRLQ